VLAGNRRATPSAKICPAIAAAAAAVCGFPCVVKQRSSRRGVGVIRCSGAAELEAVLDSLWRLGEEPVVQRFCPPGGVSRRVLVLGNEVLGATEHCAGAGEFRANAARGAEVRAVELDRGLAELGMSAARVVGLGFAGVDLIADGDRWLYGNRVIDGTSQKVVATLDIPGIGELFVERADYIFTDVGGGVCGKAESSKTYQDDA